MKNEAVGAKEPTVWFQLLIIVIVQDASHATGEQNYPCDILYLLTNLILNLY